MSVNAKGFFKSKATWWAFGAALVGAGGTLAVLLIQKMAHLKAISADIEQAAQGGTPGTVYAQQVVDMKAAVEARATTYGEEVARAAAMDTLENVYGIKKSWLDGS